ncbi:hypothetical protein [Actinoplanes philippinensis]|uniref:hypothetical protein n=1 Tax=Actinoplanes philippinensis TaxID=35752 RepID=UPI0034066031
MEQEISHEGASELDWPLFVPAAQGQGTFSENIAKGARSRPVYPYPAVTRYDGSGSTDDVGNFVPVVVGREPVVGYSWPGVGLYTHGYQTTCAAVDGRPVCAPGRPIPRR